MFDRVLNTSLESVNLARKIVGNLADNLRFKILITSDRSTERKIKRPKTEIKSLQILMFYFSNQQSKVSTLILFISNTKFVDKNIKQNIL